MSTALAPGDRVWFHPGGGKNRRGGTYVGPTAGDHPGVIHVRLDTDPYDVCVTSEYVRKSSDRKTTPVKESTKMPTSTATKPKARDLRREAKSLGVEGWEDMDADELAEAVAEAKEGAEAAAKPARKSAAKSTTASKTRRTRAVVEEPEEDEEEEEEEEEEDPAPRGRKTAAAKKAPAKASAKSTAKSGVKAPAKSTVKASKAAPAKSSKRTAVADDEDDLPENGNPFQEGSNLYWMTEELIKGGKRSSMVKRLQKKITLRPRGREFTPEEEAAEIDRRLVIVSQTLRNEHGFEMEREGRGQDTQIRLWKSE